jgi:putative transposase
VRRVARSTVCAAGYPAPDQPAGKRGPRTRVSDATLLDAIRGVLAACPFYGEGYRKVRARLAHHGLHIGGKRVLRPMQRHGLLAPRRFGHPNRDPAHAGTLVTDHPNVMWGTAATRFYTAQDGWCWFCGAIDHGTDELVGWLATKIGDLWAALDPLRQGVRYAFGAFAKDCARGLTLLCGWGPQDHGRCLDRGSPVARRDDLAVVRGRTRVQRGDRALHADAEGAVPLAASAHQSGGGSARDRRLHRAL